MSQLKHDWNSPSRLSLREACPGSMIAEIQVYNPEHESSSEAQNRGKLLHDIVARSLLGKVEERDLFIASLGDIDKKAVKDCLSYAEHIWSVSYSSMHGSKTIVEESIDLDFLGIPIGGTPDVVFLIENNRATIIDWKMGESYIRNPKYNRQLQAYAVGLWKKHNLKSVYMAIYQPAIAEGDVSQSSDYCANHDTLYQWSKDIASIVSYTKIEDAPRICGKHCGYCIASKKCPQRSALVAAVDSFTDPVLTMAAIAPEARLAMYDTIQLAKKKISEVEKTIDDAILSGVLKIPGLTIGPGRASREWKNEGDALVFLSSLAAQRGVSQDSLTELISPSKAEKLFGSKKVLSDLLVSKEGKVTVVKDRGQNNEA